MTLTSRSLRKSRVQRNNRRKKSKRRRANEEKVWFKTISGPNGANPGPGHRSRNVPIHLDSGHQLESREASQGVAGRIPTRYPVEKLANQAAGVFGQA